MTHPSEGQGEEQTLLEILEGATRYLDRGGVECPRVAAELLASRLFNCKRLDLVFRHKEPMPPKLLDAMRRGIRRVGAGEPVQYVTGETEFMGRGFKTDRRALIPRPETEVLVEKLLDYEPLWKNEKQLILDVGTGSGCIALSVAAEKPTAVVVGLDTSHEALALASENAEALGLADRVSFTDADPADFLEPETVDAVAANLPYIPTREYERLPVHIREHEPRSALDGGPDGLSIIEPLIRDSAILLRNKGAIFLEVSSGQVERVKSILLESGFSRIEVHKDLTGRDRIVSAELVAA